MAVISLEMFIPYNIGYSSYGYSDIPVCSLSNNESALIRFKAELQKRTVVFSLSEVEGGLLIKLGYDYSKMINLYNLTISDIYFIFNHLLRWRNITDKDDLLNKIDTVIRDYIKNYSTSSLMIHEKTGTFQNFKLACFYEEDLRILSQDRLFPYYFSISRISKPDPIINDIELDNIEEFIKNLNEHENNGKDTEGTE